MKITSKQAKELVQAKGLRATAPRLAVLCELASAGSPLSYTQVVERIGTKKWDAATVYRNLVKLTEAGIAKVVSRADGIARYAMVGGGHGGDHHHAHFHCEDCGRVECLPDELVSSLSVDGPWAQSVRGAMIQLRGECPDCLGSKPSSHDHG